MTTPGGSKGTKCVSEAFGLGHGKGHEDVATWSVRRGCAHARIRVADVLMTTTTQMVVGRGIWRASTECGKQA